MCCKQRAEAAVQALAAGRRRCPVRLDDDSPPVAAAAGSGQLQDGQRSLVGHLVGDLRAVQEAQAGCAGAGGAEERGLDVAPEFALLVGWAATSSSARIWRWRSAGGAALREPWQHETLWVEIPRQHGRRGLGRAGHLRRLLLQQADIARCNEAKAAGRDVVRLFDAAMGERMAGRHPVIQELVRPWRWRGAGSHAAASASPSRPVAG